MRRLLREFRGLCFEVIALVKRVLEKSPVESCDARWLAGSSFSNSVRETSPTLRC